MNTSHISSPPSFIGPGFPNFEWSTRKYTFSARLIISRLKATSCRFPSVKPCSADTPWHDTNALLGKNSRVKLSESVPDRDRLDLLKTPPVQSIVMLSFLYTAYSCSTLMEFVSIVRCMSSLICLTRFTSVELLSTNIRSPSLMNSAALRHSMSFSTAFFITLTCTGYSLSFGCSITAPPWVLFNTPCVSSSRRSLRIVSGTTPSNLARTFTSAFPFCSRYSIILLFLSYASTWHSPHAQIGTPAPQAGTALYLSPNRLYHLSEYIAFGVAFDSFHHAESLLKVLADSNSPMQRKNPAKPGFFQ